MRRNIQHPMVKYDTCAKIVRCLKNGDLAVFNEERYPFHHDTGQLSQTWRVAWTQTTGSWDCGVCELHDGTLLINFNICGFFKRGMKPEQPSWADH